jgi:hypothetical protein
MHRSQSYKLIPQSEQLAARFLAEALAAAAGVEVGECPIRELGEFAADERYGDAHDRLFMYFESLKPYREFGDFQNLAALPRPAPLQILIEPHILYGHFRSWLRKEGIDPDTGI